MRARNIKPGLYKNEDLAALPIEARWLFSGLWLLADCRGRVEDRPRRIKTEIFPYDEAVSAAKVHTLLQQLHDGGFIQRYGVGQYQYIQVTNFEKHQNPHKQEREKGSQIPDPPRVDAVPVYNGTKPEVPQTKTGSGSVITPIDNGVKPEVVPVDNGATPDDSLIPDSGFLTADSPKPPPRAPVIEFPFGESVVDHHPETTKAIVTLFEDTDSAFVRALVTKCVQEVISAGKPAELVTDEVIAYAVGRCLKRDQHGAGLFLTTVPNWIRNQAMTEDGHA